MEKMYVDTLYGRINMIIIFGLDVHMYMYYSVASTLRKYACSHAIGHYHNITTHNDIPFMATHSYLDYLHKVDKT